MLLTYNEIETILDMKYIDAKSAGYTLPPGVYEVYDNILMLKSLLPDDAEKNITIDDIRLKSNLTTMKQLGLLKKLFYLYNIRFC